LFQNFYCVLKGTKTFTLFPPTDIAFIPEETYPTVKFQRNHSGHSSRVLKSELSLSEENSSSIQWISWDPDDPLSLHNEFSHLTHPIRVTGSFASFVYLNTCMYLLFV
jgi:jumonji domain-containing protein 7